MAELEREDCAVDPDSDRESDVHVGGEASVCRHVVVLHCLLVADDSDGEPIADGDECGDRGGDHDNQPLYRLCSDANYPYLETQRDHDASDEDQHDCIRGNSDTTIGIGDAGEVIGDESERMVEIGGEPDRLKD